MRPSSFKSAFKYYAFFISTVAILRPSAFAIAIMDIMELNATVGDDDDDDDDDDDTLTISITA